MMKTAGLFTSDSTFAFLFDFVIYIYYSRLYIFSFPCILDSARCRYFTNIKDEKSMKVSRTHICIC